MALEKITGIVIDIVRHNDRSNVVSLYTRTRGRMSFVSPTGSCKSGRMKKARLMPLSVVESEISFHNNRELQTLGSVIPARIWRDIYFNPVKAAISIFLSEFLNRYLRDSSPDPNTFDFIIDSISFLDCIQEGTANFHIWFLTSFLHFAGIMPDLSQLERGDVFDMRAGIPVAEIPNHRDYLSYAETAFLPILARMKPSNLRFYKFSGSERRGILNMLLRYYAIHFPGTANLRSLDVLTELFS